MNKQFPTNNKQQKIFTDVVGWQLHVGGSRQRGQVLIVVILVLLVISLIVLAVASRSITDVKISQTSEESARAFAAAEAGVEEAVEKINTGIVPILTPAPIALPNNTTGSYTITTIGGVSDQAFLSPEPIISDVASFQVYLADKDNFDTGNFAGQHMCLMWGDPGAPDAAIEATVIYKDTSGQVINKRFAIDGQVPPRNNFASRDDAGACSTFSAGTANNLGIDRTFAFAHRLGLTPAELPGIQSPPACGTPPASCVYILRLRLLFTSSQPQYVGVAPTSGAGVGFPLQGHVIESTGLSGQSARKVRVFRSFPALPSIFDFALYSHTGDISK